MNCRRMISLTCQDAGLEENDRNAATVIDTQSITRSALINSLRKTGDRHHDQACAQACEEITAIVHGFQVARGGAGGLGGSRESFDHLVGLQQNPVGEHDSQRIGGLAVDHVVIAQGLLERHIAGPGTLEYSVDENPGAASAPAPSATSQARRRLTQACFGRLVLTMSRWIFQSPPTRFQITMYLPRSSVSAPLPLRVYWPISTVESPCPCSSRVSNPSV